MGTDKQSQIVVLSIPAESRLPVIGEKTLLLTSLLFVLLVGSRFVVYKDEYPVSSVFP